MNKNSFSFLKPLIAIACCLLFSCQKNSGPDETEGPFPPDTMEILKFETFTIEKKNNPSLDADILFTFKGDSILSQLPLRFDRRFVPTFSITGDSVYTEGKNVKSGITAIDFAQTQTLTIATREGERKRFYVKISWIVDSLPHIYINTDGGVTITSKDNYVNALVKIDGKGKYSSYEGTTGIRGRGNSTWGYPKKPYRLKLGKAEPLFGLASEKDWVLLANYLDPTLMLNATAMKIGKQLGLPYTNNIIPVNVTLNGVYIGCYNFTEQVEEGSNRVNVGDEGQLLELDTYYDEAFKFRSVPYNLPVNVKHPEPEPGAEIPAVAATFNTMTGLLAATTFPANPYKEHIDIPSVAKFLIVNFLTDNEEINHPKSTYMHKTASGKYIMGPIWDFDWAYGYEGSSKHFLTWTKPPFWSGTSLGTAFFRRFLGDPEFVALLKQEWNSYKANHFGELIDFVSFYGLTIHTAKAADYTKWGKGAADNSTEVHALQEWLQKRAQYIDTYLSGL